VTKILTVIFILVVNYSVLPQLAVATPELKPETTFYFGKDIVLLGNEPIGVISGIQNSLGTIYVAINDTQSTYNLGLVIRKSTDRGKTWITENGINHRDIYGNIKLLRNFRLAPGFIHGRLIQKLLIHLIHAVIAPSMLK